MHLRPLAPDLWVAERPFRFLGLPLGVRMTVVRIGGDLLLHSPVAAEPALVAEVEALGRVRWIVAPNKLHHLFAGAWQGPGRELWGAAGLAAKRPDLPWAGTLDRDPPWPAEGVAMCATRGMPFANEVVLCHRPSRTLILTDLAMNFGPDAPLLTQVGLGCACGYPGFRSTLLERVAMTRDVARRELAEILAWDFDRVVVCHGDVLETGGREALRAAYAWLLG